MAQALQTDTATEQARDHMLRLMIAEQNDAFRRTLGFAALWRGHHLKGRTVVTTGVRALPEATQAALMEAVITFTDWTEENDPWEDHSFGRDCLTSAPMGQIRQIA
jgi:hypothetical protein